MNDKFTVRDELYLWFLGEPSNPVFIGNLRLIRATRGVSLTYSPSWIDGGFALSEDLPLLSQEFFPSGPELAAGAVNDARPDRWGERIIRFLDKPGRLSLLEYLYFAGDERFGALGVSTSSTSYEPRRLGPLPTLKNVERLSELVQLILNNEPVPESEKRLLAPGVTMGGAKPKALVEIDGAQWVVKFGDGDSVDTPLIEHAAMTLALTSGIRCAATRAIRLIDGHAVAVARFDRVGCKRIHSISAHVALMAAGEPTGYPELAQLLRRRGGTRASEEMNELFRRMVFNILIDNTDDHEKNHALMLGDNQRYELSPAFDVLPSGQALGFQQMRVGVSAGDSTLENALSMSQLFALTKSQAITEVKRISKAVAQWKIHFAHCGVSPADIETLSEQIDRPFLKNQRDSFSVSIHVPQLAKERS